MSRGAALPTEPKHEVPAAEEPLRRRILDAAFAAFSDDGYAATSTLEIATRAKVSKRDLYTLIGNKQELLVACITDRAARLSVPAGLPEVRDRATLEHVLIAFGEQQLRVMSDPNAIAMFRLAIGEAERAPEIAQALESIARVASRASLRQVLTDDRTQLLLAGDPLEMGEVFMALLLGNVMLTWLLGVGEPPKPRDLEARAQRAAKAFLRLYLR
jgi:AcrR family transcriptional regulator